MLERGKKLPAPTNYHSMPVLGVLQALQLLKVSVPRNSVVNVFMVFVNIAEIKPFTELNVVTANPLETVTWALHSEKRLCCSG